MKTISIDAIPEKLVLNVIQIAEVYQMVVKKTDATVKKDVMLISPLGKTIAIDRLTLVNNFVNLLGNPIKMISIKFDQKYTVMRTKRTECLAVKVVDSEKVSFTRPDGSKVKSGKYLVLEAAKVEAVDGKVDFSEAAEIDSRLFRKLYCISKLSNEFLERLDIAVEVANEPAVDTETVIEKPVINKNDEKRTIDKIDNSKNIEKAPTAIVAVKVIVSDIDINETIGYVISNGVKEVCVYKKQMIKMVYDGAVENMKYVSATADKKAYLAGVGMKIAELPKITVSESSLS